MTFKVCNCCSKHPYFNRAYVVRGRVFFGVSVGYDVLPKYILAGCEMCALGIRLLYLKCLLTYLHELI